jgi:predicted acetyltransferase
MEGDQFLLKYSSYATEMVDFLLSKKWETQPGMDIGWIIRNIDNLFILTDFHDVQTRVGFMVKDNKTIYYFEILPKYRNKGYAKSIIKYLDFERVCVSEDSRMDNFWKKVTNPDIGIEFV